MDMEEMEVDMENNNDEVSKKMNPATFGFGGFEATSTAGKKMTVQGTMVRSDV